jgi:hypothetical protein
VSLGPKPGEVVVVCDQQNNPPESSGVIVRKNVKMKSYKAQIRVDRLYTDVASDKVVDLAFNPDAFATNDACSGKPTLLHHFPNGRETQRDALEELALGDKANGRRPYVCPDGLVVGAGGRWAGSAAGRDGCGCAS